MLEQSFIPKECPRPQFEYPDALLPLYTNISIRIHTSVMDKVLEYYSYDHFSPAGPEHYIVAFPFMENDYYYQILFSFGPGCECLEPKVIREKMKRRIEALAALY
jgi:Predicted transcriptional regulator